MRGWIHERPTSNNGILKADTNSGILKADSNSGILKPDSNSGILKADFDDDDISTDVDPVLQLVSWLSCERRFACIYYLDYCTHSNGVYIHKTHLYGSLYTTHSLSTPSGSSLREVTSRRQRATLQSVCRVLLGAGC